MKSEPRCKNAGFTLIEVLIALVILALAAGFAFRTMSEGFSSRTRSALQQEAVICGQSALASIGKEVAVKPGVTEGSAGLCKWRIDIAAALTAPPPAQGLAAYPVEITVLPHGHDGEQALQLQTVRLGADQGTAP